MTRPLAHLSFTKIAPVLSTARRALSIDQPNLLSFDPKTASSNFDMGVLDARCRTIVGNDADKFLSPFDSTNQDENPANVGEVTNPSSLLLHPTTIAMRQALERDNIGPNDTLVVSLSGGVDSMCHVRLR